MNSLINVKSVTINENTLALKKTAGLYVILHNDLCITSATEFNYINNLYDNFLKNFEKNSAKKMINLV